MSDKIHLEGIPISLIILARGMIVTVLPNSLLILFDTTTTGLVLLISLPIVGSSAANKYYLA